MELEDIFNKLHSIEQLILKQHYKPLNLVEASEYLSRSQSDIYKLTRQRKIPCHKPTGKYLYFFREELDGWIKQNSEVRIKKTEEKSKKCPDGISKTKAFHRGTKDPASPNKSGYAETPSADEDWEWFNKKDGETKLKITLDTEEKEEPP